MPRLIWTPAALRDLTRLRDFLVANNPIAAERAIATIRQGVRLLADHPEIGRPAEDMPLGFREWPIGFGAGGYIAVYRIDAKEVVILTVRHGKEAGD
jgi:addiction module RelE/StbE family toxin